MFRGVSNLNIDAKGRMAMPVKYRDRLLESCGGRLIITVDPDGCLLVYPLPEWEQVEHQLMRLPSKDPQARRLQRLYLGHATECELDTQGRVLLSAPLREYCGVDKRAVLLGQGNKFELWDEETWNERRTAWLQEEGEASELTDALASLSL